MCKESVDFLWVNRNYRNSREYSFLERNCRNAQKFSWQRRIANPTELKGVAFGEILFKNLVQERERTIPP